MSLKDDDDGRESHKQSYVLSTVEIKDHKVMIDGRNFFGQPIKIDLKTCDSIRKINRSRQWLHNRMFIRLSLFQKIL